MHERFPHVSEDYVILRTPSRDVIEQDYLDALGVPSCAILPYLRGMNNNAVHQDVWKRNGPPTDDLSTRDLYRDHRVQAFMFNGRPRLDLEHFTEDVRNLFANDTLMPTLLPAVTKNPNAHVLDYGAGLGAYSIAAWAAGAERIVWADIPHDYFRFMRHVCPRVGMNIGFCPLYSVGSLKKYESDPFDYIINSEVMEHCWNPLECLEETIRVLKPGGLMYLSTFFNDLGGEDPFHLKHNNVWQDSERWFKEVEKRGMKRYFYDPRGVLKVFRKES